MLHLPQNGNYLKCTTQTFLCLVNQLSLPNLLDAAMIKHQAIPFQNHTTVSATVVVWNVLEKHRHSFYSMSVI